MPHAPKALSVREIDIEGSPLDIAARWPADRPLLVLRRPDRCAAGPPPRRTAGAPAQPSGPHPTASDRLARWSILTSPECWLTIDRSHAAAPNTNALPCEWLDTLVPAAPVVAGDSIVPFVGGWIGSFSYDLGRSLEPAAQHAHGARDDRDWPLALLARVSSALVHDAATNRWFGVGHGKALVAALEPAASADDSPPPRVGAFESSLVPDRYLSAASRVLDLIAAGDVFQVNLAHRLTASFTGSTRALALRALASSGAGYGAYLELPGGRAIVSMSPELFVEIEGAGGIVTTRPIKGTRPVSASARELARSAKDAAELHMIVDLMRNDLGRVCAPGTVSVPCARTIERHGTVRHGVGEVCGRLREGAGFADVMRAAFPPGSVTGAPKIRAMQIIDELEPVQRGPYCGAIGFVSETGRASLSVAIRTIALEGVREPGRWDSLDGRLDYGVGGGIVADSRPLAEYRETLVKAEALREAIAGDAPRRRAMLTPRRGRAASAAASPRSGGSGPRRSADGPR